MATFRTTLPYQYQKVVKTPTNPHGLRLELQDGDGNTLIDLINDYLLVHNGERVDINQDGNPIYTYTVRAQESHSRSAPEREADLEEIAERISEWNAQPLEDEAIWLYRKNRDEAGKRTLVLSYEKKSAPTTAVTTFGEARATRFDIALTCQRGWESIATLSSSATAVSLAGGTVDLSTVIPGDAAAPTMDGRISDLRLEPDAGDIEELWLGIKPYGKGVSEFDPVLQAEDGIEATGLPSGKFTDTTMDQASGTSDAMGNVNITTFSTTTDMVPRWTISIAQAHGAVSDYTHFIGQYRVLLRYRVTNSADVIGLALRLRFTTVTQGGIAQPPTYQAPGDTTWHIADLGIVNVPPAGYRRAVGNNYNVADTTFELSAEQLSGSGSLESDALFLVPARYGLHLNTSISLGSELHLRTHEDMSVNGYVNTPGFDGILAMAEPEVNDAWAYPKSDPGGVLVAVASRSAGHVSSDVCDIDIEVIRRWVGRHG